MHDIKMLILDSLTKIEAGSIRIPYYHRGHLSLKSDTRVTVMLLPGRRDNPYPILSELIISPISFPSWQHLTRINARVANRPGVLRKMMAAIAEAELDLLYHASGPLENGRFQRVEFLVDAKPFYEKLNSRLREVDKNPDNYILFELERWLKSLLISDLCFDGMRARLKVRPMEAFRRAWRAYRKFQIEDDYPTPIKDYSIIQNGAMPIPKKILECIHGDARHLMLNSDTKDRMLRGIILERFDSCTCIRVVHNDVQGSTAKISDTLATQFQFVTSLSRIKSQGGISDIELMLYSPKHHRKTDEKKRRSIIETLLSDSSLEGLNLRVSYPTSIGSKGPRPHKPTKSDSPVEENCALPDLCPIEEDLLKKNANSILNHRIEYFHQIASNSDGFELPLSARLAYEASRELLCMQGDHELGQSRIFVSYPFVFDKLYKILNEYLRERGFVVITGKGIDGKAAFRQTIIERICSCHGFIGIWKYDERLGPIKFSPWLSWELGIAQSHGMPVRILPHEAMNKDDFKPHRAILPDINMPAFSDTDFKDYVSDRIESFKEDVQLFEKRIRLQGSNRFSQTN